MSNAERQPTGCWPDQNRPFVCTTTRRLSAGEAVTVEGSGAGTGAGIGTGTGACTGTVPLVLTPSSSLSRRQSLQSPFMSPQYGDLSRQPLTADARRLLDVEVEVVYWMIRALTA